MEVFMSRKTLMSKFMVFMLALAVVFTYSVMPMSQAYAASAKKPAKVTIKKATAVSMTSFKVTWKKAKNAKKYQVYVSTKKSSGFKRVITTKKTSYTVKKLNKKALKAGKKYYVKVRALNGNVKGKWSKVKAVTTLKEPSEKEPTLGESKTAIMSTYIDMSDANKYPAGKVVKVWVPVPQTEDFQTVSEPVFEAPKATEAKITVDSETGNKMLYLEWGKDVAPQDRKASLVFTGTRVEVKRTGLKNDSTVAIPASAKKYINKESTYVKVKDPIVQEYALKATK
jgi:fibronectin type 3 domain-containing protein